MRPIIDSHTIFIGMRSSLIFFDELSIHSNFNRDVNIVTVLDTFTSLLSGFIIFGILGHLAFVTGAQNISDVVKPGPGLAFISYPDAIAKFEYLPQVPTIFFKVLNKKDDKTLKILVVFCPLLSNVICVGNRK